MNILYKRCTRWNKKVSTQYSLACGKASRSTHVKLVSKIIIMKYLFSIIIMLKKKTKSTMHWFLPVFIKSKNYSTFYSIYRLSIRCSPVHDEYFQNWRIYTIFCPDIDISKGDSGRSSTNFNLPDEQTPRSFPSVDISREDELIILRPRDKCSYERICFISEPDRSGKLRAIILSDSWQTIDKFHVVAVCSPELVMVAKNHANPSSIRLTWFKGFLATEIHMTTTTVTYLLLISNAMRKPIIITGYVVTYTLSIPLWRIQMEISTIKICHLIHTNVALTRRGNIPASVCHAIDIIIIYILL